jgi:hypothetical protein
MASAAPSSTTRLEILLQEALAEAELVNLPFVAMRISHALDIAQGNSWSEVPLLSPVGLSVVDSALESY